MDMEDKTTELQLLINSIQQLIKEGEIPVAIQKAEESVDFSKRHFGERSINTASTYSTLGACLSKDKQDEKGKEMLEKALAILSIQTEDCRRQMANVKNNLSAIYRKLRLPRQALQYALEAVELRLDIWGLEHYETATSIGNLGYTLSYIGYVVPALKCYLIAAPFDTVTQLSVSNYKKLMDAIEGDDRFTILKNDLFDDDFKSLDLDNITAACKKMLQEDLDDELFHLKYGQPAHAESYSVFVTQLKIAITKYHSDEDIATPVYEIINNGRSRLYRHIGVPIHSGKILLKQIDRAKLGPLGRAALTYAFPNFSVDLEPIKKELGIEKQHKSFNEIKLENLKQQFGEENISISYSDRQYRRYAGDNNLPAGCYHSVCQDVNGDDGQTLCRELYEYTDLNIPGFIWVSDSWDQELMDVLKRVNQGEAAHYAPGIYVFMLPPIEEEKKPLYHQFYAPILEQTKNWDGLSIVHIATQLKVEEFEKIIDLRQQETQEWFSQFFKQGDGGVFYKQTEVLPNDFMGILPALVYPEFGGSGVTKSLGSWMRLMGIDALVYPSARSDAGVEYDSNGKLSKYHGWNLVDYRKSHFVPDREMNFDINPWYDFIAGRQEAPSLIKNNKSWKINGSEKRYRWERGAFIDLIKNI